MKCMAQISSKRGKFITSCSQHLEGWVRPESYHGAKTESYQGLRKEVWGSEGTRWPAGTPNWTHRAEQGKQDGRPRNLRCASLQGAEIKAQRKRKREPGFPGTHVIHVGLVTSYPAGSLPACFPTGQDHRLGSGYS